MTVVETSLSEVTSTHGELTRGQWQAHVGSHIFDTYYRMLVDEHPPEPVPTFKNRRFDMALINIGEMSARNLVRAPYADSPADTRLLTHHVDDLLQYTDLEFFTKQRNVSIREALWDHVRDGLDFAHCITMGTVIEVIVAGRHTMNQIASLDHFGPSRRHGYRFAEAILVNPSFPKALSTLAITGFAVLGNDSRPVLSGGETGLRSVKRRLHVAESTPALLLSDEVHGPSDLMSVDIRLHPEIARSLRRQLGAQNRLVKSGDSGMLAKDSVLEKHLGRSSVSSGCPVAHHTGTFEVMCDYLAQTVRLSREAEERSG